MRGTEPTTPEVLAGQLGLDAAGFNLVGSLTIARYDSLVSEAWREVGRGASARSALVVASGGRALFHAFSASPESTLSVDPVDTYTRRVVDGAAHSLGGAARAVYAFEKRGGVYADFIALAQASGLGAPGRLGLLLHPEFGPWLSIRAILLSEAEFPETPPLVDYAPCTGCSAPCAVACHGSAVSSGSAAFDVSACSATRASQSSRVSQTSRASQRGPDPGRDRPCALRCDARRACVVGPEHAYTATAEAHHMRHSLAS